MTTTQTLPDGYDDESSPFHVPEEARPFYSADLASLEGVYDLDALASTEASYEFSIDHTTGSSSVVDREPGRDALIARALHRRAVQLSTSRVR